MTEKQFQEFETVTHPVIEWLNANYGHPHITVVVNPTGAQLSEGLAAYTTLEFIGD